LIFIVKDIRMYSQDKVFLILLVRSVLLKYFGSTILVLILVGISTPNAY
jgi:hypothetical protein